MFEKKYLIGLLNSYPTIDSSDNAELRHLTIPAKISDLVRLGRGEYHVLTDFFFISNKPNIGISIDDEVVKNVELPVYPEYDEQLQVIWLILYQPLFRACNRGQKIFNFITLVLLC